MVTEGGFSADNKGADDATKYLVAIGLIHLMIIVMRELSNILQ